MKKRIKWNIDFYPMLTHYIVAPNMKYLKVPAIMSVSATKRIVKSLEAAQ